MEAAEEGTTSDYTPRPWAAIGWSGLWDGDRPGIMVFGPDRAEGDRIIRLIAAAPDLLEAVSDTLDRINALSDDAIDPENGEIHTIYVTLYAAWAKATGAES